MNLNKENERKADHSYRLSEKNDVLDNKFGQPDSPNVVPNDYFLFPLIKNELYKNITYSLHCSLEMNKNNKI